MSAGGPIVVERFIFGREFHVNMIEERTATLNAPPRVLPLCEIQFTKNEPGHWPVYTFTAKWHENSEEYRAAPVRTAVSINADDFARQSVLLIISTEILRTRIKAVQAILRTDPESAGVIEKYRIHTVVAERTHLIGIMGVDRKGFERRVEAVKPKKIASHPDETVGVALKVEIEL